MEEAQYKIWSNEHQGWWRPARCGYTKSRSEAGTYTFSESYEIVRSANIGLADIPNEAMVRVEPGEQFGVPELPF